MAAAKKCDRCGNYYEENKNQLGKRYGDNDRKTLRRLEVIVSCGHEEKSIDLCDECWKKFYKWMEDASE